MIRENYVTIDLGAIRDNYWAQKQAAGQAEVMAVVKADAYGHGIIETAKTLQGEGVSHFAVAIPEEGIKLREAGIQGEILILGAASDAAAAYAVEYGLCQTVFCPDMLPEIERQAELQHKQALVHIKLDTGMNRIGLKTMEEAKALQEALRKTPMISVKGIYTHFADADEAFDEEINEFTKEQLKRYCELRTCFPAEIPSHVCNSAMALRDRDAHFNMIRQGISLYGYPPIHSCLSFRPALRWQTVVSYVKRVRKGERVGYGRTYTASRDMLLATASVGYGDGYHRHASNRAKMLVHGKRAPVCGNICMDQVMLDVTEIPDVRAGDEVVMIGAQGNDFLSAEEVAEWAGTISYEVLLSITSRVPRRYLNSGKEEKT